MSKTDRDFKRLLVLSAVVGVLVGLFSAVFTWAWHAMDHLVWSELSRPIDRIWFSTLVGLVIGIILTVLYDPGSMATIVYHFHRSGRLPMKDNAPILPVSLLGLAGGQSAGPEGALTQAGGSLGGWLANRLNAASSCRLLTLAGMGAGFGAFLGAPIGGAVLWLEMLHTRGIEYYEAIIPTLLCSSVAYLVMAFTIGHGVVQPWHVGPIDAGWFWIPAVAAMLGLACGPVAKGYAVLFHVVGRLERRIKAPLFLRTTVAGLIIGTLGYFFPLSYFYGGNSMTALMAWQAPLLLLGALLLAKMLAASVTIRGHWQGGLIIPHFFMGAILGKMVAPYLPAFDPTLVMLCCMAGFNAAATQTPLASGLIVLALTGCGHPVPVFLASMGGFLTGQGIVLIENKQARSMPHNFHLQPVEAELVP